MSRRRPRQTQVFNCAYKAARLPSSDRVKVCKEAIRRGAKPGKGCVTVPVSWLIGAACLVVIVLWYVSVAMQDPMGSTVCSAALLAGGLVFVARRSPEATARQLRRVWYGLDLVPAPIVIGARG